jgi:glycosyltransferase involved in cell wall biosynthesis
MSGVYRRLGLFMSAIGEIADSIDMLHLVPDWSAAEHPDPEALDASQSAFWSRPVHVTLSMIRRRRETFVNHYLTGIADAGAQKTFFPYAGPDQAAALAAQLARPADLLFVHRLAAMLPLLRLNTRPARVFFDLDDIEHHVALRACLAPPLWPGKLATLLQIPAIALAERRGAARADLTFVCSEPDRRALARIASRTAVIPNVVALPPAPPPLPASPTLMFLGAFNHAPNVDAAERLVREILPLVRAAVPDAIALIAGEGSQNLASRRSAPPGVEYLGFVDDLAALYARSRVICCPITAGGGTRIKLIEAAAYARPIVATRIGAEGLAFADGAEILLRESDTAIAEACVRLLRDDALCLRLGDGARAVMQRDYEASSIRTRLISLMQRPPPRNG